MKSKYHVEITEKALRGIFSAEALQTILKANIKQDKIRNQINHDEIHFDGSAFEQGFKYIDEQEKNIIETIMIDDFNSAWKALGRLTHSWQDFYSHSNYVELWLGKVGPISPEMIDHDDQTIIHHPNLKSGNNVLLIELLAMVPVISRLIYPLFPEDSHAKLNLDSPKRSPLFAYAYWASFKRTQDIVQQILLKINKIGINQEKIMAFKGQ